MSKGTYQKLLRITEVVEIDWERDIPPEEMNELVRAINQMKRERGDTDFIEPVTEPEHNIYYGDHAVSEIVKHVREGICSIYRGKRY